jgi:hypothetical protein
MPKQEATNMPKKLTLLAMSVGALVALVVPATSGAAVLTEEINPGVLITVTAPTLETTTALGAIDCSRVVLHGVIDSTNSETDTTKGHGTGGSAAGCSFQPGGQSATVSKIKIGNLESVGMDTTVSFSYAAKIPVGGSSIECEVETPEPSPLEVTTGTDVADVAIFLESALCGESEIHGETTWETSTPLFFSEG